MLPTSSRREKNLAFGLKDPRWMDAVTTDPEDGAVLFAAGLTYYFPTEDVKSLATGIAKRFQEGRLVFDAAGKTAVRLMLKTWVKPAGVRDVGAYFSVKDARRELEPLVAAFLTGISSRGYMPRLSNHFMIRRFGPSTEPLAKPADRTDASADQSGSTLQNDDT